jgi:hypothetical protein
MRDRLTGAPVCQLCQKAVRNLPAGGARHRGGVDQVQQVVPGLSVTGQLGGEVVLDNVPSER